MPIRETDLPETSGAGGRGQVSLESVSGQDSVRLIMATVATPEQVAPIVPPAPQQVAESQPRAVVQRIAVDGSTLSVIAIGIALFTMAFGAFTHLSGRIDGLDTKIERLDTKIERQDAKIERLATRTDEKFDKLDAKIESVARDLRAEMKDLRTEMKEVNAKIDRLSEQISLMMINQNQGK